LTLRRLQKAFQKNTITTDKLPNVEVNLQAEDNSADSRFTIKSDNEQFQGIRLSIGLATQSFKILETFRLKSRVRFIEKGKLINEITIRIEGVSIDRHDRAREILENLANSILFQIDLLIGLPMYLAIEEERELSSRSISNNREKFSITFPEYQYNSKAMSLYWYASTARRIPLLQYLAYYQVIEFYFPVFAEKEAQGIIRRKLKNPSFDKNSDIDISKLIEDIKPFIRGYGDERSTIIATVKNCVSEKELREFFQEDSKMFNFFKDSKSKIAEQKISVESSKADILNETANRIYEIRCKIVHTKSIETGSNSGLLLPFSKEAQQLSFDIELVKFVARKVLIDRSEPLKI
jgi:hypothetical protein